MSSGTYGAALKRQRSSSASFSTNDGRHPPRPESHVPTVTRPETTSLCRPPLRRVNEPSPSQKGTSPVAGGSPEMFQAPRRQQSFATETRRGDGVNVKVLLRCRPLQPQEKRLMATEISVIDCRETRGEVVVKQNRRSEAFDKCFQFDGVCGPATSQQTLFDQHVVPLIDEVLLGFNGTIFAYGQTGTGKTYTMEGEWTKDLTSEPPTPAGDRHELRFNLPRGVGVIPRAVALIFEKLSKTELEYSLKVSYLEIYNEELNDLLQEGDKLNLRIYDKDQIERVGGATRGLPVDKLEEFPVHDLPTVYHILSMAVRKRRTAETLLNRQSSRSHSIFTITVTMKETSIEGEDIIRIGKLNLVDLAGSENIQRSGTQTLKDRTKEAGMINQSLLTLGRVINALIEHSSYVPYRDSKLTRLLQDSLGGRTKTCIIATISPSPASIEETLSTLDYAHRAKHIRNRPEINQRVTQKFMLRELTQELDRIKQELCWAREKSGGVYLSNDRYSELKGSLEKSQAEVTLLQEQLETAEAEKSALQIRVEEGESARIDLESERDELCRTISDLNGQLEDRSRLLYKSLLNLNECGFILAYKSIESSKIHRDSAMQTQYLQFLLELGSTLIQNQKLSILEFQEFCKTKLKSFESDLLCNQLPAHNEFLTTVGDAFLDFTRNDESLMRETDERFEASMIEFREIIERCMGTEFQESVMDQLPSILQGLFSGLDSITHDSWTREKEGWRRFQETRFRGKFSQEMDSALHQLHLANTAFEAGRAQVKELSVDLINKMKDQYTRDLEALMQEKEEMATVFSHILRSQHEEIDSLRAKLKSVDVKIQTQAQQKISILLQQMAKFSTTMREGMEELIEEIGKEMESKFSPRTQFDKQMAEHESELSSRVASYLNRNISLFNENSHNISSISTEYHAKIEETLQSLDQKIPPVLSATGDRLRHGTAKLEEDLTDLRSQNQLWWQDMNTRHLQLSEACGAAVKDYVPKLCGTIDTARRQFKSRIDGPLKDCWKQQRLTRSELRTAFVNEISDFLTSSASRADDLSKSATEFIEDLKNLSQHHMDIKKVDALNVLQTSTLERVPALSRHEMPMDVTQLSSIVERSGVAERMVTRRELNSEEFVNFLHQRSAFGIKHHEIFSQVLEIMSQNPKLTVNKTLLSQSSRKFPASTSSVEPSRELRTGSSEFGRSALTLDLTALSSPCYSIYEDHSSGVVEACTLNASDEDVNLMKEIVCEGMGESKIADASTCSRKWITPRSKQPFWHEAYSMLNSLKSHNRLKMHSKYSNGDDDHKGFESSSVPSSGFVNNSENKIERIKSESLSETAAKSRIPVESKYPTTESFEGEHSK